MKPELLVPGVQHGREAVEGGAQSFIGREFFRERGFRIGMNEDAVRGDADLAGDEQLQARELLGDEIEGEMAAKGSDKHFHRPAGTTRRAGSKPKASAKKT